MIRELDALVRIFALAEALVQKELLQALARGTAPSTAAERTKRLANISGILAGLRAEAIGKEGSGAVWDVITSAYRKGQMAAGGTTDTQASLGGIHLGAVRELYNALTDSLEDAIAYVGRRSNDIFRKAALNEILVGQIAGRTRSKTGKAIEENLRSRGVKGFRDKAGREWSLANYAKMAAHTAAAEAQTVATLNRLAEQGIDLVKVSEHPHPHDVCSRYEGRVFSISGTSDKYPPLKEAPPFHPFCKHVLTAFVEALASGAVA